MRIINQWQNPDGSTWLVIRKSAEGFELEFPHLAQFSLDDEGDVIRKTQLEDGCEATLDHLYLNQVLPLALSLQNELVLHASAVNINGQAAVFCGSSGMGKSSIAAAFATAGYPFLTDDGLLIEPSGGDYLAVPSHPFIRLWDDSRDSLVPGEVGSLPTPVWTEKSRLLAGEQLPFCDQKVTVGRVYFLQDEGVDSLTISPLLGADALMALVRNSFFLDISDRCGVSKHFHGAGGLVRKPLFYHLDYPRAYGELPGLVDGVLEHMEMPGFASVEGS